MAYFQSTYLTKVYREFKAIDPTAYRQLIRYYEKRSEIIGQLEFEEFFEVLVIYVEALFEVGAYHKHIVAVDTVIEYSITYNIHFHKGKDIYYDMLFKKAASHFNLVQYEKAEHILKELIKINPNEEDVIVFLKKCLRRKNGRLVRIAKASSILLFLITAMVISIEVLLVRPFYRAYAPNIESFRTSLFIIGILILILGDLIHRVQVEVNVKKYVSSCTEKSL